MTNPGYTGKSSWGDSGVQATAHGSAIGGCSVYRAELNGGRVGPSPPADGPCRAILCAATRAGSPWLAVLVWRRTPGWLLACGFAEQQAQIGLDLRWRSIILEQAAHAAGIQHHADDQHQLELGEGVFHRQGT